MSNIKELTAKLKAAALDEIMCREACDTSDLWQDVASPENVLALVGALEDAQAQSSKWLEAYHKAVSIGARYEDRIASLEARTLTVKLPKRSVGEVMQMSGFSRDYAEGWCSGNDNARHEIAAAGIKLQIEGE